jgi:tight adherence protein B
MNVLPIAFIVLIFIAIFLLAQGLMVPAVGESARTRRRLRHRLSALERDTAAEESLLRNRYLGNLSPLERKLESWPGMAALRQLVEQAGLDIPGHRIALSVLSAALMGVLLASFMMTQWVLILASACLAASLPLIVLVRLRHRRVQQIEQQLPEALDIIKRSLRAGHPFVASVKLVAEDLDGPVAREFEVTAADLSFGSDPRAALMALVARVPSLTLMGFVTAVLIQRETGGNLAEILDHISTVIRERGRFQRQVRTLSAEGRASAWVLTLLPIGLAALLHLTSPDYLTIMFADPLGQRILLATGVLMVAGIFWMRHLIRIDV